MLVKNTQDACILALACAMFLFSAYLLKRSDNMDEFEPVTDQGIEIT